MSRIARFALLLAAVGLVPSIDGHADGNVDPLFAGHDLLQVTITAPLRAIMKERPMDEYVSGLFVYKDAADNDVEFTVGLRTRGRFRRRDDICDFAPLRINFKKSATKGTLFDGQDKLKLVTHCENNSPRYQQSVISEYLAYRILNLLTDISFKARLLEVTYVDTDSENREMTSYAVFIEHQDRMSKRIDLPIIKTRMITVPMLVPEYAGLTTVFQYFLGNTDFSQVATAPGEDCCHNHELFGSEDKGVFSVPYDFDMTGFVNAPHALPNARFRLRTVRNRLYRGRCVHNGELPGAFARFQEQREAIYKLINSTEQLNSGTRRSQLRFVDGFYKDIATDKKIESKFTKKCL